jgi:hypothetical protein
MRSQLQTIDDLRRQYSISGILGVERKQGSTVILCPLPMHVHSSNTPSFSIYDGRGGFERFHCHGNCGVIGDVIDLIGFMEVPGFGANRTAHVAEAMMRLERRTPGSVVPVQTIGFKASLLSPAIWKTMIPSSETIESYMRGRGVNPETMEKFKIGSKKELVAMPTFEDGILRNIKYRRIGPTIAGRLRYFEEKGSRKSLFNHDAVAWQPGRIVITKGHIPTMILDQYGLLACNITAGENGTLAEWAPRLSAAEKLIYIGDNDRDPEIRKKMQEFARIRAAEVGADVHFPPDRYKDLDKWVLGRPEEAIPAIKNWLGM